MHYVYSIKTREIEKFHLNDTQSRPILYDFKHQRIIAQVGYTLHMYNLRNRKGTVILEDLSETLPYCVDFITTIKDNLFALSPVPIPTQDKPNVFSDVVYIFNLTNNPIDFASIKIGKLKIQSMLLITIKENTKLLTIDDKAQKVWSWDLENNENEILFNLTEHAKTFNPSSCEISSNMIYNPTTNDVLIQVLGNLFVCNMHTKTITQKVPFKNQVTYLDSSLNFFRNDSLPPIFHAKINKDFDFDDFLTSIPDDSYHAPKHHSSDSLAQFSFIDVNKNTGDILVCDNDKLVLLLNVENFKRVHAFPPTKNIINSVFWEQNNGTVSILEQGGRYTTYGFFKRTNNLVLKKPLDESQPDMHGS
jgi:hypothetical protein